LVAEMSKKRAGGRIFFGSYSMPDPDDADLRYSMHEARYGQMEALTRADMYQILAAAEAYLHFVGHLAGTEAMIQQLREVRREVAVARKKARR